jgi:predicted outer membrane repeat protein
LVLALLPIEGVAATHRVPSEYATINTGLDASAYGDTVLVASGTYSEWDVRSVYIGGVSSLVVTSIAFLRDGVTLLSEAGPEATILDMTGAPVVEAAWVALAGALPGVDTRIEGFSLTGAPTGWNGLHIQASGRVNVSSCTFLNLDARPDWSGGGLSVWQTDVEIVDSRFENCHGYIGGAIYIVDSNAWIDGIEVRSCSAAAGGGIRASSIGAQNNFALEVRNSRFVGNSTELYGGGAAIMQGGNGFRTSRVVENCYFEGNHAGGGGGAISMQDFETSLVIVGNVFIDNSSAPGSSGGGATVRGTEVEIRNNTFYECRQDNLLYGGSGILIGGATTLALEGNVFAANFGSAPVGLLGDVVAIDSSCNVFWENEGGTIQGAPLDATDRITDPLFCDAEGYDLTVSSLSPCLPVNSLGCGLIGALGQGCGAVSIEPMSWGQIKGAYR